MNPDSTKNTPKQKEAQNNVGGKIPKRGPKGWLIYGMNPSCTKKIHQNKI